MKTLADWKLHSWYRTRDGRKAWLAAIAIGPDGDPIGGYPLKFYITNTEIWTTTITGARFETCYGHNALDILGPWTDEPRPLGRYDPVTHPPTEVDGERVLVYGDAVFPYTTQTRHVLDRPAHYKWWCPLKPILEMEVSE